MIQASFSLHGNYCLLIILLSSTQERSDLVCAPLFSWWRMEIVDCMRKKLVLWDKIEITSRRELVEGEFSANQIQVVLWIRHFWQWTWCSRHWIYLWWPGWFGARLRNSVRKFCHEPWHESSLRRLWEGPWSGDPRGSHTDPIFWLLSPLNSVTNLCTSQNSNTQCALQCLLVRRRLRSEPGQNNSCPQHHFRSEMYTNMMPSQQIYVAKAILE